MELIIREMRREEYPLLETFLYEAIFQRDPVNRLPQEVIYRPELYIYIADFGGKPDDRCLCAEREGRVIGAVWTRIIPAYGHIDDATPEFAISLLPEARGQGVGTALMRAMLERLKRDGYARASLAVQKDNYALRMYQKVGFQTVDENDEEYIMICDLTAPLELKGGRDGKIFRTDRAVLRPRKPWSESVQRFLAWTRSQGADFVPAPMGMDEAHERLSWMPGTVYNDEPEGGLDEGLVASAARLLRRYHDMSAAYVRQMSGGEVWMLPARTPAEVMCHGDYAPYNVTIADGEARAIIDFDTLHPGPRLWDLAYAAYRWAQLSSAQAGQLERQIHRIRVFVDAYGATEDQRRGLPDALAARLNALMEFMQGEADEGDADFQRDIARGDLCLYQDDIRYWRENRSRIVGGLCD